MHQNVKLWQNCCLTPLIDYDLPREPLIPLQDFAYVQLGAAVAL
jgi:hypothetical protein